MSSFLFTYGSLMYPEVMTALTSKNFHFEDVEVKGFERKRMKGKRYPGLFRCEKSSVSGRLWFDIDELSMNILDSFEDDVYERATILVPSRKKGETVKALAYLIALHDLPVLEDDEWNPDTFESEHLISYIEMCGRARQIILAELNSKKTM